MKRISLIIGCLLLVGCGGGSGSSECKNGFWNGEVGTCLPESWEILEQETVRQRGVPEETVAVFQAGEAVSGHFPTVAITREQLVSPASSSDFSLASMRSVEIMVGYELVDTKKIKIDGEEVSIHIFNAQPVDSEPMRRFYQVSALTGADSDVGFTATAVTPMSIKEVLEKEVYVVLENLTFEGPEEEKEE